MATKKEVEELSNKRLCITGGSMVFIYEINFLHLQNARLNSYEKIIKIEEESFDVASYCAISGEIIEHSKKTYPFEHVNIIKDSDPIKIPTILIPMQE